MNGCDCLSEMQEAWLVKIERDNTFFKINFWGSVPNNAVFVFLPKHQLLCLEQIIVSTETVSKEPELLNKANTLSSL
jgi:hypothetical protein